MDYVLTEHAQDALQKRSIRLEWLERALITPQKCMPDEIDADLEHRLVTIPEYGNRVLRVIINTHVAPERVVTVYFDRGMRGKL